MITKRSDALFKIEQYKSLITFDREVIIAFDAHSFTAVIKDIELVKVTGFKNAPEKRLDSEGKYRTPMLFQITTNCGNLIFPFDDVHVSAIHQGLRIDVQGIKVDIRYAD